MRYFLNLFLVIFFSQFSIAQGGNENTNVHQNSVPASVNFNNTTNGNSISSGKFNVVADTVEMINEKGLQEIKVSKDKSDDKFRKKTEEKNKSSQRTRQSETVKEESEGDANVEMKSLQEFETVQKSIRTQDSQRSPTGEQQMKIDQLVREMKSLDSTSFTYHLTKFIAGNYNVENSYHINQAFLQNPNDSEVLKQITALSVVEADSIKTLDLLEKQIENKVLDPTFIDYGSDLLMSAPTNSTLITHSFDDTYGSLYNQLKFNQRKDVKVINLDFCQSATYRKNLVELGYQVPDQAVVNTEFLSDFISFNQGKTSALSLTLPKNYFLSNTFNITAIGLVFITNPEIEFPKNNDLWENQLTKKVLSESSDLAKKLSLNYLPMLIELRKQYSANNQTEKVREVDRIMEEIGKRSGKSSQIQEIQKKN